ncbi:MAG: nucleotidyltransferase family protein [Methanotrichaceae archaeon]|nr:nucleotidyltransferase family protein [Methanotrichaceae archaeon]
MEYNILLTSARVLLGTEEANRLEEHLLREPDYDKLLNLANRHRVLPILYRSISQNCPQSVPRDWLMRIKMQYMQNAARNLKMTGELLLILDTLKEAGINAVPLKGPVLAQQIYGDISLRQFSDLDILIAPRDVKKAVVLLVERDYGEEKEIAEIGPSLLLKGIHHHKLLNKKSGTTLELHWKSSPGIYSLQMEVESILEDCENVLILGKEISSLEPEYTLIFLSQHGMRHTWERLSWIIDEAALLSRTSLDWNLIRELNGRRSNKRVLLLSLLLVRNLMNIAIPKDMDQQLRRDKALNEFGCEIMAHLIYCENDLSHPQLQEINRNIFYSRVFNNPAEKALCFLRLATIPTNVDLETVNLPKALFPIYYIIRPIRLAGTYLGESLYGLSRKLKR